MLLWGRASRLRPGNAACRRRSVGEARPGKLPLCPRELQPSRQDWRCQRPVARSARPGATGGARSASEFGAPRRHRGLGSAEARRAPRPRASGSASGPTVREVYRHPFSCAGAASQVEHLLAQVPVSGLISTGSLLRSRCPPLKGVLRASIVSYSYASRFSASCSFASASAGEAPRAAPVVAPGLAEDWHDGCAAVAAAVRTGPAP